LLETLVVWLANTATDAVLAATVTAFLSTAQFEAMTRFLIEVAASADGQDGGVDQDVDCVVILLLCSIGLELAQQPIRDVAFDPSRQECLRAIGSYLTSISNRNQSFVRLTLLHYFGQIGLISHDNSTFVRVVGRFGHTALDHLFQTLMNKKSEAIALQYLQDNLIHLLKGDSLCQRIIHDNFRHHMLKVPERFCLFLQNYGDHLVASGASEQVQECYLRHLGALVGVISEVNHRHLARDIMIAISRFRSLSSYISILKEVAASPNLRPIFGSLLRQLCGEIPSQDVKLTLSQFKVSKRGRKPTLGKFPKLSWVDQVLAISGVDLTGSVRVRPEREEIIQSKAS
jgi:hypothetical protein